MTIESHEPKQNPVSVMEELSEKITMETDAEKKNKLMETADGIIK